MNDGKFYALWLSVGLFVVSITLAYAFVPEVLPAPTPVAAVELNSAAFAPSKPDPLPPLLELTVVPELNYSLPQGIRMFGPYSCPSFEVLPTHARTVFVLDALDDSGSGLERLNPCVRDHATHAGDLVVTQCRGGDSLDKAFSRALTYLHLNCDLQVPQFDLQMAPAHDEFLGNVY